MSDMVNSMLLSRVHPPAEPFRHRFKMNIVPEQDSNLHTVEHLPNQPYNHFRHRPSVPGCHLLILIFKELIAIFRLAKTAFIFFYKCKPCFVTIS